MVILLFSRLLHWCRSLTEPEGLILDQYKAVWKVKHPHEPPAKVIRMNLKRTANKMRAGHIHSTSPRCGLPRQATR